MPMPPDPTDRESTGSLTPFIFLLALPEALRIFFDVFLSAQVPKGYAIEGTLSLAAIAVVVLWVTTLKLVLTVPIGFATDFAVGRLWHRRQWFVLAAAFTAIGMARLLAPLSPQFGVPVPTLAGLYGLMSLSAVGLVLLAIVCKAWALDLIGDYHSRTRIMAAFALAAVFANWFGLVNPSADGPVGRMLFLDNGLNAVALLLLTAVLIGAVVPSVPPRERPASDLQITHPTHSPLLLSLALVGMMFLVSIPSSIARSIVIFAAPQWQVDSIDVMIGALAASAATVVFCALISEAVGKHRTLTLAIGLSAAMTLGLAMGLDSEGTGGAGPEFAALIIFYAGGASGFLIFAMAGDVAQLAQLKSGQTWTGVIVAALTAPMVLLPAAAPLVIWWLLEAYGIGFDWADTPQALLTQFWRDLLLLSAACHGLVAAAAWFYPLTQEKVEAMDVAAEPSVTDTGPSGA